MRFDAGQYLRTDQRMKLAPRMIQSMEILHLSQQALEERIEQELASNPTLEQVEAGADRDLLDAERQQERRDDREGEREMVVSDDGNRNGSTTQDTGGDDFERLSNLSEQYGDSWSSNTSEGGDSYRRPSSYAGERDAKMDAMANTAARGASLFEQLMDQWRLVEIDDETAALGEYLLGYVDADGYLRTPPDELLRDAPPGTSPDQVDECTELLQEALEPTGLCARNLRECLLLQIDDLIYREPDRAEELGTARLVVSEYLPDLEANRYPAIAKATGLPIDRLKAAVLHLRRFHPHPGRLLATETVRTLTPDATIEYDDDSDHYTVALTHSRLPAIQISRTYEKMAKDADAKTREFVGTNLRNARWLIDAVRQRHATLLRVIRVVIEAQRDFFEQGAQALKPLPMTLVADQLGIHVATVSRAVNEKYLQTPRGIFPLRMFFSGGTETDEGEAMSWAAVQAKLEEIIGTEDKHKPLSDDALVDELKKAGIELARRTVAKYRNQLNIPAARQRREY